MLSRVSGEGGVDRQSTEDFLRAVKLFCMILGWWIDVIMHFCLIHRTYNTKHEPCVNCGLWVIMLSRCGLICCNKCAIVWQEEQSRGGCACVEEGQIRELSELSVRFFCEPKITLEKEILF